IVSGAGAYSGSMVLRATLGVVAGGVITGGAVRAGTGIGVVFRAAGDGRGKSGGGAGNAGSAGGGIRGGVVEDHAGHGIERWCAKNISMDLGAVDLRRRGSGAFIFRFSGGIERESERR